MRVDGVNTLWGLEGGIELLSVRVPTQLHLH
jgi:hypothetical protein